MRTLLARLRVTALAATLALIACLPASATAATAPTPPARPAATAARAVSAAEPTWRVLHQWPHSQLTGVVAIGPRRMWAVLIQRSSASLLSFNGVRWRTVTSLPPALMPEFFAASSADNIWVFGTDPDALGTTTTFRWNGTAWQQGQLPPGTGFGSAAVLSASRVWYAYGNTLWRLSGSTWISQPAEADVDVAAGPGGQVWQVGRGRSGVLNSTLVARSWTGSSWHRVRMPHPAIRGNPQVSVGSAGNVWIMAQVAGRDRYRLLHWNGHRWRTITVPAWAAEMTAFAGVTAVGSDSAWFSGDALWDGRRWLAARDPVFPVINVPPVGVPGTGAAIDAIFTSLWISGRL